MSATTPMEQLLGSKLFVDAKGTKKSTTDAFKNKELVALYFSAHW
jgi:hypothetical protein